MGPQPREAQSMGPQPREAQSMGPQPREPKSMGPQPRDISLYESLGIDCFEALFVYFLENINT